MQSEMPDEAGEPSPETLTKGLIRLLDVEAAGSGPGLYRGKRKPDGVGRVYGGQVVAQALAAAIKTVDVARTVHSLHAYFLRGGNEKYEIDYRVEADFDGGSFSNRRVIALQQGEVILNLAASFQIQERGHFHQPPMPHVPPPEALEDVRDYIRRFPDSVPEGPLPFYLRPWPIEIRCIGDPPFARDRAGEPHAALWFRVRHLVEQPQSMHRIITAYASDLALIATAVRPHAPFKMQGASLDHSLWFHQDVCVDDWLLYTIDSPWAGAARGLSIGRIFDRTGRFIATVAQEGLMRDITMRDER